MTKHSKNNTASSIFSYAEYKKLDYGTKRQRLGNESMRRFDACSLCLQTLREPVACSEGHLFCKECVYTDLLTQKKDIKRQKAKLDAMIKDAEEEKQRAKEAARERVLLEFERGHVGLSARPSASTSGADTDTEARGTKRKFNFSPGHVDRLAAEAEEAALQQIKAEQAEALKAKLPDFWLPSLTPTHAGAAAGAPRELKDIKVRTICRGGTETHDISLKTLTPINFTFPNGVHDLKNGKSEEKGPMCPSCKKDFSNSIIMFLMRPCSHVFCKACVEQLVRPSAQCVVCDKPATKKDIVELKREGTGFASGGLAETSKTGVAFQG